MDLTCCICYNEFNMDAHLPRVIPSCGHSLCSKCLNHLIGAPHLAKCPLDKKILPNIYRGVEGFPINFALKEIIEQQLCKEMCKDHNAEITLICLTDQALGCADCMFGNDQKDPHKNHQVKSLKQLKSSIESKTSELKGVLTKIDHHYKVLDQILDEKREGLVNLVRDHYRALAHRIEENKLKLIFDVNGFFDQERDKLNIEHISIRTDLSNKITDRTNFALSKNIKNIINEDVSETIKGFKASMLRVNTQRLNTKLDQVLSSYSALLACELDTLSKTSPPKLELSHILETELNGSRLPEQISLFLETVNDQLFISTHQITSQNISLKNSQLDQLTSLYLTLSNPKLSYVEIDQLNTLINSLTNLKNVHLFIDNEFLNGENLAYLWTKIYQKPNSLEEIGLHLGSCKVEDKLLCPFFTQILSNATNLSHLSLDFSSTHITDYTLKRLASQVLPYLQCLESLTLNFSDTKITDKGLMRLFQNMPDVMKLDLWLKSTGLTDKSLESLTCYALPSMDSLEDLRINFSNTKTTDKAIIQILNQVKMVTTVSIGLSSLGDDLSQDIFITN